MFRNIEEAWATEAEVKGCGEPYSSFMVASSASDRAETAALSRFSSSIRSDFDVRE